MQYLIYKPPSASAAALFAALRGDEAVEMVSARLETGGPDGEHGSLWYFADRLLETPHLAYSPDRQTWRRMPGSDCWLGWQTENRPTPESLLRGEAPRFDGEPVTLNDGQRWTIPTAMSLPTDFDLDDAGNLIKVAKPAWQATYTRTVEAWQIAAAAIAGEAFEYAAILDYVTHMLAWNYRLTREIAVLLGLFDEATAFAALLQTLDRDRVLALLAEQKKTDHPPTGDSLPITSGAAA